MSEIADARVFGGIHWRTTCLRANGLGLVQRYYTVSNLLGIYIVGVPIEELLFAAMGGAVGSIAYEYLHGCQLTPAETS